MRGRWVKGPVIAALLVATAAACSQGSSPEPSTPQITKGADDEKLNASLISLEDLEGLPDAPTALMEQPIEDASAFENPDPRGPCGAKVPQPAFRDAALAAFVTAQPPNATIVHAVWELPGDDAEEFLEAHRRDTRPGCPVYRSTTPTGTQEVKFLEEVGVPGDTLANTVRITVKDAEFYASIGIAREGTALTVIMMFGEEPMSPAFVGEATQLIAAAL